MTGLQLYLSEPFAQHALIAGALVAITCGLIGPFVVTRRMAFAVHGTSELAFTGAAAGLVNASSLVPWTANAMRQVLDERTDESQRDRDGAPRRSTRAARTAPTAWRPSWRVVLVPVMAVPLQVTSSSSEPMMRPRTFVLVRELVRARAASWGCLIAQRPLDQVQRGRRTAGSD